MNKFNVKTISISFCCLAAILIVLAGGFVNRAQASTSALPAAADCAVGNYIQVVYADATEKFNGTRQGKIEAISGRWVKILLNNKGDRPWYFNIDTAIAIRCSDKPF